VYAFAGLFYFVSLPHTVPDGTAGRGLISISTNIPSLTGRRDVVWFSIYFYQHSAPLGAESNIFLERNYQKTNITFFTSHPNASLHANYFFISHQDFLTLPKECAK